MTKGTSNIEILLSSVNGFQIFAGVNNEELISGRTSAFVDLYCKMNISMNTLYRIYIMVETTFSVTFTLYALNNF